VDRIPVLAAFSAKADIAPGYKPASCTVQVVTGLFTGRMRIGYGIDHPTRRQPRL